MCSCGQGRVVHAEYSGGEIVKGSIVAAVGDDGQLDMRCAEPFACSRLLAVRHDVQGMAGS